MRHYIHDWAFRKRLTDEITRKIAARRHPIGLAKQNGTRPKHKAEAGPLAQAVNRQVKIAQPRPNSSASFALFGRPINPLLELPETDDVSAGFYADAHFITVVLAKKHETMDSRPYQAPKNGSRLGDHLP
jgi:hypothetical protein